jgi:hypothetical protein
VIISRVCYAKSFTFCGAEGCDGFAFVACLVCWSQYVAFGDAEDYLSAASLLCRHRHHRLLRNHDVQTAEGLFAQMLGYFEG